MISAAASDGVIDARERARIVGQPQFTGLEERARDFLLGVVRRPATTDVLVSAVRDPQHAIRLYICSLLSVQVETEAERDHPLGLAERLRIPSRPVEDLYSRYLHDI